MASVEGKTFLQVCNYIMHITIMNLLQRVAIYGNIYCTMYRYMHDLLWCICMILCMIDAVQATFMW